MTFAVADPDDEYVASIDLRLLPNDPLMADVGYMTAPHARGRGYLPAALAAVCARGLHHARPGPDRAAGERGQHASRRAAEKAGFTVEGTLRGGVQHRGERQDVWIGGLLPGDLA
ncbi:GNAT family N-acetyltransferase [Micromonospora sp. BRA006-A]|nr:GNAT family N-acetyltransferase [Micromonospora sp. BRA006-A]